MVSENRNVFRTDFNLSPRLRYERSLTREREVLSSDETNLLNILVTGFLILKKYRTLIGIFAAIGFLGSLAYYFSVRPLYRSEMVFRFPSMDMTHVSQILKKLDRNLEDGDHTRINTTYFNPDLVHSIDLQQTPEAPNSFTVRAVITNPDYWDEFQAEFMGYISTHEYVKNHLDAERRKISQTLQALDRQESRLDEVLNGISTTGTTQKGKDYENIADAFGLKLEMEKQRIDLESKMAALEGVEVIEGFSHIMVPFNKNATIIILLGMLGAVAAAILIALALEGYAVFCRYLSIAERQGRVFGSFAAGKKIVS